MSTKAPTNSKCVVKLEKLDISPLFTRTKKLSYKVIPTSTRPKGALSPKEATNCNPSARGPKSCDKDKKPSIFATVDTTLAHVAKPGSVFIVKDATGKQFKVMTTGAVMDSPSKEKTAVATKNRTKPSQPSSASMEQLEEATKNRTEPSQPSSPSMEQLEEAPISPSETIGQVCFNPLSTKDVIPFEKIKEMLENYEDTLSITNTNQPEGGQVYLYDEDVSQSCPFPLNLLVALKNILCNLNARFNIGKD